MNENDLKRRLIALRDQRRMSQAQLAKLIGKAQSTVSRHMSIDAKESAGLSIDDARLLAEAMDHKLVVLLLPRGEIDNVCETLGELQADDLALVAKMARLVSGLGSTDRRFLEMFLAAKDPGA